MENSSQPLACTSKEAASLWFRFRLLLLFTGSSDWESLRLLDEEEEHMWSYSPLVAHCPLFRSFRRWTARFVRVWVDLYVDSPMSSDNILFVFYNVIILYNII